MIAPRDRWALGAGIALALAMPAVLLWPAPVTPPRDMIAPPLAAPVPAPPLAAAFARTLFANGMEGAADAPADAPVLAGIVGRLDADAVALVRTPAGTRTLAAGETVDGWRLESLSADAAYFTRGAQKARVGVPAE